MSDEPVMTPITPEESGGLPPKVAPFGAAPAPAAPRVGEQQDAGEEEIQKAQTAEYHLSPPE